MRFKVVLTTVLLVLTFTLLFVQYSISKTPYKGFIFTDMPKEITANPGDTIEIKAGLLNIGWWWLHNFNLTLTGLPEDYEYNITPQYFDHFRILRAWNPTDGLYRVPENFTLTIKIPETGFGLHLLNLTGQEFFSWRKVGNSTLFLLKVISLPNFTISDMIIPEIVRENEPFTINFTVNNGGVGSGAISILIEAPEDWDVSERTKTVTLDANTSTPVEISITPTNTSGTISIYADYMQRENVINITKTGPYLVPLGVGEEPVAAPTGLTAFVDFVLGLGPIVIGIGLVLLVIIVWNVWGIYKGFKERKKPEEMKKQVEPSPNLEL